MSVLCYFIPSIYLMIFAGFPPITTQSGTSFVTTAPEATTALFPIVIPGLMMALPPIQTLSPIVTGFPYSTPELRSNGSSGLCGCIDMYPRSQHTIPSYTDFANIQDDTIKIRIKVFPYSNVIPIVTTKSGLNVYLFPTETKKLPQKFNSFTLIGFRCLIV